MSIVDLVFQTATSVALQAAGGRTQIGWVTVDVAIEMEHAREAQVTEHPVETGVTVSDHVILRPARVNLSGFVTDTPLFASGLNLGTARSSATFFMLQQMMEARQPIMLMTPRRLYQNMVIERLSIPEGREAALRFECSLVEIKQVTSQNASLPPTAEVSGNDSLGRAAAANGGGIGKLVEGNVANPSHATGVTGIRAQVVPVQETELHWVGRQVGLF